MQAGRLEGAEKGGESTGGGKKVSGGEQSVRGHHIAGREGDASCAFTARMTREQRAARKP